MDEAGEVGVDGAEFGMGGAGGGPCVYPGEADEASLFVGGKFLVVVGVFLTLEGDEGGPGEAVVGGLFDGDGASPEAKGEEVPAALDFEGGGDFAVVGVVEGDFDFVGVAFAGAGDLEAGSYVVGGEEVFAGGELEGVAYFEDGEAPFGAPVDAGAGLGAAAGGVGYGAGVFLAAVGDPVADGVGDGGARPGGGGGVFGEGEEVVFVEVLVEEGGVVEGEGFEGPVGVVVADEAAGGLGGFYDDEDVVDAPEVEGEGGVEGGGDGVFEDAVGVVDLEVGGGEGEDVGEFRAVDEGLEAGGGGEGGEVLESGALEEAAQGMGRKFSKSSAPEPCLSSSLR